PNRVLPRDGSVCPREIRDVDVAKELKEEFEAVGGFDRIADVVGPNVVADVVVGPAEPEGTSFVAAPFAVPLATAADRDVPLDDVVALIPRLGSQSGTRPVVQEVPLDQTVVAIVDGEAPLKTVGWQAAKNGVADKSVLVAVGLAPCRSEQVGKG